MANKTYTGTYAFKTDPGKIRIVNEDQVNVLTNHVGDVFLIVCDGIGGQSKGDYASRLAINYLSDAFLNIPAKAPLFMKSTLLRNEIRKINQIIFEEASTKPDCKDMGTTLVCALISKRRMIVANSGDSRAYMFNDHRISRLTSDQTYVNYLYKTGKISESETLTHPERHVLMNALGIFPSLSLDVKIFKYHGEGIILCSDGLYNNVSEREIFAVCSTDDRVEQKVDELVKEANNNGGSDNIAVALWETTHD